MAFRQLVGGECGGNNGLVQLSNILGRDGGALAGTSSAAPSDRLVAEFLAANPQAPPQTFQMNALLHSLKEMHAGWADDFQTEHQQQRRRQAPPPTVPAVSHAPQMRPLAPLHHGHPNRPGPVFAPQYADAAFDTSNYLMQNTVSEDEVRRRANELVNATAERDVAYTEFVNYMKKVGSGEASLVTPETPPTTTLDPEKFAENNQEEWNRLKKEMEHPWLTTLNAATNPFPTYAYASQNAMLENPDALELGKRKLKAGDVPGAVLCFEAAVRQSPGSAEGWLLLGTTQAENEQDPQAIAALTKCVELDPTRLEAHMTLGSSYTNENYSNLAYKSFNDWLKANSKYSDLVPLDVDVAGMSNAQLQEHIQTLFIRAAQMYPSRVDPDIQCALGVLFNISQEYGKAVDCFKSAITVRGDDSRLWNKLGATLANGERSEEAVDAYFQALALEPGFIRARYNIGITCMNLGAYKEAAEHFLTALNQQAKAQGVVPNVSQENTSSSTIWSTLRMVCAFMGKHEFTPLIDERNLQELNRHFEIS